MRRYKDDIGTHYVYAGRFVDVLNTADGRIEKMVLGAMGSHATKPLAAFEYKDDNLVTVFDALNQPYRFFYQNDMMVQHKDRNGLSFFYEYDELSKHGKCVHAFGDGGLYDYQFEYLATQTRFTNSLGHKRTLEFDENQLPLQEFDRDGVIEAYEYDEMGRTTAVIDGAGNRTEYVYDDFGNVLNVTRADGTTVVTEYDDNHNAVMVTDPNGSKWCQQWDSNGLLKKQITPLGNETTYGYGQFGELTRVTDPNGSTSTVSNDKFGNAAKFVDPQKNTTLFSTDICGNIVHNTSPLGKITKYQYDNKNRITKIINPSGSQISAAYDGEDNLTHYRDENGDVTTLEYCGLGEIKRRIQPDGSTVEYTWDTEEQLVAVINERKQRYKLNRNQRGYIVEEVDYWGASRKYVYNDAGHLKDATNPLERRTQYTCDPMGRLQSKVLFDGEAESYEYDSNGNLTSHKNSSRQCSREFDAEGKFIKEQQDDFWISYGYDKRGNRVQRHTAHGNKVEYQFNFADDLISLSINDQPSMEVRNDAEGRRVKEILGEIVERDYEYNDDGLLTKQHIYTSSFELAQRKYAYDPVGNLTSRTDGKKGTTFFSYDPMGRLTKSVNPKGQIEKFLHDPAGDLLKSDHVFDDETGLRTSTYQDSTYQFDKAGNLTKRTAKNGVTAFEWNGNERLSRAINEQAQVVDMSYDAQGRRVSKTLGHVVTKFHWDGDHLLSDEKNGKNVREFVYYPGTFEPLAHIDKDGEVYYYQNDNVGLPHEVCNANGHVVWSATFGPFGAIEEQHEHLQENPLRFQGQYYDKEIDLSYNRFRYYEPNIGAFVSQDPLGLFAGDNAYRVAPNIWTWVDPLGLDCYKATRTPGGVTQGRRISQKQAQTIVRSGGDVMTDSRSEAMQLAKRAIPGRPMKHQGHQLPGGGIGRPHVHPNQHANSSHIFY